MVVLLQLVVLTISIVTAGISHANINEIRGFVNETMVVHIKHENPESRTVDYGQLILLTLTDLVLFATGETFIGEFSARERLT